MSSSYFPREECASCGSTELREFIDYGEIPLAGYFPKESELDQAEQFPLALLYCSECALVQTNGFIDPDVLFKDYRYLSSVGLSDHFSELALRLEKRLSLSGEQKIVEIGSNDGVFLVPMMRLGLDIVGFEPSTNISKVAEDRGCKIINDYFALNSVGRYLQEGSVDLIFAANCFAHIDKIDSVVQAISYVLKPEGSAIIEVHDVKKLVYGLQYDFVYHEHLYYYSLTALTHLFSRNGMTIADFEEIPVHSGSIRIYVNNKETGVTEAVKARLDEERSGVADWNCYTAYARNVERHKHDLIKVLKIIKQGGQRIVGYGASGRANVLCNFCGIGPDIVDYIVDESPERYDRYIPIQNIPIKKKEVFDADPDIPYVLIFAWNYSKMIIDKLKGRNCKFIIPFPQPVIVEGADAVVEMQSL